MPFTTTGSAGDDFDYALTLQELRFTFRTERAFELATFNASMWRGALGHALRRTACVTGARDCRGCPVRESCAYSFLFETPPPAHTDRMRRYDAVPHPLVIRNQSRSGLHEAGDAISVDLLLLGEKARSLLPFVVHAMQRAGHDGLGRGRVPMQLETVVHRTSSGVPVCIWGAGEGRLHPSGADRLTPPPPPGHGITLRFLTPLRLMSGGRMVLADDFRPVHLLRSLTRRLSMLEYFHAGVSRKTDFKSLHRRAEMLQWGWKRLQVRNWVRYSSRQKTSVRLPGIVGEARLDGPVHESLWPWLWIGQHLHAGKATVMGLGRYRLEHGKLAAAAVPSGIEQNTPGSGHAGKMEPDGQGPMEGRTSSP